MLCGNFSVNIVNTFWYKIWLKISQSINLILQILEWTIFVSISCFLICCGDSSFTKTIYKSFGGHCIPSENQYLHCIVFKIETSDRALFFSKVLMIYWTIFLRYFAFNDLIRPLVVRKTIWFILNFWYGDVWDNYLLLVLVYTISSISIISITPLGKITSRRRPGDVPEKRPDVLRTSPCGPICNAKGRILSGTSLGRTQDVNLTIIHKTDFYGFFYIFPDSNCISDNALPK